MFIGRPFSDSCFLLTMFGADLDIEFIDASIAVREYSS